MKWAEITLHCSPDSVDAVSALLTSLGCGGTCIREGASEAASPVALPPPRSVPSSPPHPAVSSQVTGYLPVDDRLEGALVELKQRLRELPAFGLAVEEEIALRTVEDQDWESAWKAYFKPLRVGHRLVIKPSWERFEPRPGDLVLELDPGMAFGTGAHPTTQLCLEALEATVQPGERVLDFGTGSGILALAAARLGATVVGVDNDPVAASAADLNVTANRLRDRVRILGGDLEAVPAGERFDGIVANILAGVILDYAEELAARCRAGGWLIASGIIDSRADAVAEGLRARGFVDVETRRRGEWVALVARRGVDG